MNLRYEILKACAANPGAPIDEIADTIKYDRKKTAWAVRDCAKEGLLSKRLDDVTGQLGIQPAGKERAAVLYLESDLPRICAALVAHLQRVVRGEIKEVA